jgi:hypothetical protein
MNRLVSFLIVLICAANMACAHESRSASRVAAVVVSQPVVETGRMDIFLPKASACKAIGGSSTSSGCALLETCCTSSTEDVIRIERVMWSNGTYTYQWNGIDLRFHQ